MHVRLLLVTLLTVSAVSHAENLTTTTTITPTTSSKLQTFVLSTTAVNFSLPTTQAIIVENGDSDPLQGKENEIDLTAQIDDEIADTLEKDAKVETNEVIDAAPKIVVKTDSEEEEKIPVAELVPMPVEENDEDDDEDDDDDDGREDEHDNERDQDEDEDEDDVPATHEADTTSTQSITAPKTTPVPLKSSSESDLPQDGVVLPTDDDKLSTNENSTETKRNSTYEVPMTFWEQCSWSLSRFAEENPKSGMIILSVLFSILLLLVYLVLRECCEKRRRRYNRSHRAPLITDDLYNTSSCSHRYSKVVIPDQRDVTMRLCSTDSSIV